MTVAGPFHEPATLPPATTNFVRQVFQPASFSEERGPGNPRGCSLLALLEEEDQDEKQSQQHSAEFFRFDSGHGKSPLWAYRGRQMIPRSGFTKRAMVIRFGRRRDDILSKTSQGNERISVLTNNITLADWAGQKIWENFDCPLKAI
jgi:hypothetical protein